MKQEFDRTLAIQKELLEISRFDGGTVPSIPQLFAFWGELVQISGLVSQELSRRFSAKEKANIDRKIAHAKAYISHRKLKLTGKDSEIEALNSIETQFMNELDAMSDYEDMKLLLQSIDRAISFIQSLQSRIANMERSQPPNAN